MQVLTRLWSLFQFKDRCLRIDYVNRNQSRCTGLRLYTDIISAIICKIALSRLDSQLTYTSASVSNIFSAVKYQITVDRILILIILYQLKTIDPIEPFFLVIRIVIKHNSYSCLTIFA